YLERAPQRTDVRSIWVGLRPLVRPPENEGSATKQLSREHTVLGSPSGLVTVTGGKWTTYRAMAEDVLEKCAESVWKTSIASCRTADFPLVGAPSNASARPSMTTAPGLNAYGTEAPCVADLPGADIEL